MKKTDIIWKKDGWTTLQEADAEKHVLEIACRANAGEVIEVRIRHNDGEEKKAEVLLDGAAALPMKLEAFKKNFTKGLFEIK